MLKVGVISDTHIRDLAQGARLAERLCAGCFAGVTTILHAGDVGLPEFLDFFGERQVHAVRGNTDVPVAGVPIRKLLTLGGFRIALVHGWGAPFQLEERLLPEFQGLAIDCLVYGHSHQPTCRRVGDLLLFNPGSATDRRDAPRHTVGLLEIGEHIAGSIIPID
ncbi:metallophosphoesterase family protein [Trichloromonas sp.]|uniref:metallophosphoesterase family protein n=1 Tax=Trichloromonas sp. TaxID=3069249 RepID=UPI002A46EE03|nr:metallophosphoesterase family protein [Trichloromonas sp.]